MTNDTKMQPVTSMQEMASDSSSSAATYNVLKVLGVPTTPEQQGNKCKISLASIKSSFDSDRQTVVNEVEKTIGPVVRSVQVRSSSSKNTTDQILDSSRLKNLVLHPFLLKEGINDGCQDASDNKLLKKNLINSRLPAPRCRTKSVSIQWEAQNHQEQYSSLEVPSKQKSASPRIAGSIGLQSDLVSMSCSFESPPRSQVYKKHYDDSDTIVKENNMERDHGKDEKIDFGDACHKKMSAQASTPLIGTEKLYITPQSRLCTEYRPGDSAPFSPHISTQRTLWGLPPNSLNTKSSASLHLYLDDFLDEEDSSVNQAGDDDKEQVHSSFPERNLLRNSGQDSIKGGGLKQMNLLEMDLEAIFNSKNNITCDVEDIRPRKKRATLNSSALSDEVLPSILTMPLLE